MIKKLINQTKRTALFLGASIAGLSAMAQSASFGTTYVHNLGEATVITGSHSFANGSPAALPGLIGTDRAGARGYFSFAHGASHTGASNTQHVDGYVKTFNTTAFIFPIGDNGVYRPARVSIASLTNPANAAYYGVNPTTAVTSSLKGGNEPALPSGGTYASANTEVVVKNVSTSEYWDINGAAAARISLTWNAASDIAGMTGSSIAKLTIVGWDGTQWVRIASTIDATSVIGGASNLTAGSITTDAALIPNTYDVYTLAAYCPQPAPTAAVANPNPICVGSSSVLTAAISGASDTLRWYSDASLTALVGIGNPINASISVSPPLGTTIYYASAVNGICKSPSTQVSLLVNPIPNISSVDSVNPSTCTATNGSITLKGLLASTAYGINYTGPSGGLVTTSGTTNASGDLTIPNLSGGSYTNMTVSRLGCVSNAKNIQLTPAAPTMATPNTTPICLGKSSILSATGSGGTITWFSDAALTASLGTGSPLTITPSATSTYYAVIVNGTCKSFASNATVTVATDCPTFPIADTTINNLTASVPKAVGPVTNAPTGGTLSAAILSGFSHRAADAQSINPTSGVVTYTPNDSSFVGQDTIIRQICFTLGGVTTCDTSLIIVNNKAPNNTDTDTTNLNTPKTLAALTPLVFEGGTPATTTSSPKVTVTAGVPTYTPTAGFVGIDTQYVYRCDAASPANCDTTRLIVTVLPNIADSKDSTTVNTPVNLGPAVTPSPNVTQTVTASNGTTIVNPDGTIKYTPNPNFVGTDTIKREVCVTTTAGTTCDTQLMIINVAPKYNDTTVTTPQGTPVTSGQPVLTMSGSFSFIITSGPSNGTKVDNPGGTVTYTPNPSFVGRDTITRRVCTNFPDGSQKCDTSLLIFIVSPKVEDSKDSVAMNGGPVVTGSPVSGSGITVSASSKGGSSIVNPDGTVTYKPNTGFTGIDTITRIICDTTPNPDVCDTSYIVMKVTPDLKDSTSSGKMNTSSTVGQPVTLGPGATQQPLEGPKNGTATINPDGTIKYTPNNNFVGMDTIKRIICVDGKCDTGITVVRITPDVKDSTTKTKDGTTVTIPGPGLVAGGGSIVAYTPAGGPKNGTATVNPTTGVVTYTPRPGFTGKDTIKVSICVTYPGSTTVCDTHLVIIDVAPANKTNPDIAVGDKGVQIAGNVSTNDIVLAGTTYGTPIASTSNPSSVVPVMNANGTYTFTANVAGTYVFTIPVCPPGQFTGCPTETLTITVKDPERTDNKPIVNTDYPITKPNTPVKVNVLANDASGNVGFPLNKSSLTVSTAPKNGTATVNVDGTISYTPKPSFVGKDTFYYTICDSVSPPNCGSAMVVVNVTNADVADVQDDLIAGKGVLTGNTLANDKFPVGSKPYVKPQDIILSGQGRFVIDSAGIYTWTPEPGFSGTVTLVITTCDGKSPETCFTSTLYVAATNQASMAVISNYFSPNGDGVNDVWNLDDLLTRYPNARALIYNRWGNIVWRSTGPYGRSTSGANLWHGQQEGSQDLVPDGVYYYLLELDDEFKTTKTGFIEVMRQ